MGLIDSLMRRVFERDGNKHSLSAWPGVLAQSGAVVDNRFSSARPTDKNAAVGAHVIGIERWGQSRLRVFLGEPLVMDEYDGYRPPDDMTVTEMITLFRETRAETVHLAESLAKSSVPDTAVVPHNQAGDLTVRGWLAYLDGHSTRESSRLKN